MKSLLIVTSLVFLAQSSFCQTAIRMPVYKNSFSMEFTSVSGYAFEMFNPNGKLQLPAFALNGEFRLKGKFYGEIGFMPFGQDPSAISQWDYTNYNSNRLKYAAYAGSLMKFRMANNLYFTPSLDLFFFQNKYIGTTSQSSQNDIYFGLGGSIGFEYFLSNRISINTDIFSISYGLKYDTYPHPGPNYDNFSYLQKHGSIGLYKMLSLGIHYNFNWKK